MINSLIASMNGTNSAVQQAALELFIKHFPVHYPTDIFFGNERIIIIENGFKLLRSNNDSITWNWLFPINSSAEFTEIKQRALIKLFDISPKNMEDSKAPLEILQKILEKIDDLDFLVPIIVPMLSFANKYNDSSFSDIIISNIMSITQHWPVFKQNI